MSNTDRITRISPAPTKNAGDVGIGEVIEWIDHCIYQVVDRKLISKSGKTISLTLQPVRRLRKNGRPQVVPIADRPTWIREIRASRTVYMVTVHCLINASIAEELL